MPDLIGRTLGPYRVVEQIGLGGMATVYKAYQPSMDRYVALKVLSTHLTQDPAFIKRFQQEAQIIAKLEHLHILPVYDHGEEDGFLYLVMRYIEAGTLKDRLKPGALALDEARRVVNQVGSALEYAHQLGVVHRDIKPSNVLVDPQGDCYLTDFGISKMIEGTLGLTGFGVIGTPHYMAPEQSKSLAVDHRADIYAMGVVIYEMVTGQLPYDAETPFAVAIKHITEPLPLPRKIRPDLPEAVERVILRALAKEPADRYQSMRDLVTAFDQAVGTALPEAPAVVSPRVAPRPGAIQEPASLAAPTGRESAPAWKRWLAEQPPWLLPAAGLALVVLLIAGVVLSRIPGRVEIAGGQVQLVTPTAAVTSPAPQAAEPTGTLALPTRTPNPTPKPTTAIPPTTTLQPSGQMSSVVGLRWEKTSDGAFLPRVPVNAIKINPRDPGVIYAGSDGAGLYKSSDGGSTWQLLPSGLDRRMILSLALDPQNPNTILAGTSLGGVFKSTDSGQSWRATNDGLGNLQGSWEWIGVVAPDLQDGQHLYYADCAESALWTSTNGGANWEKRESKCPRCIVALVVDPKNGNTLYAAEDGQGECPAGVYKSTDGGWNWRPASQGITDVKPLSFYKLALDPQNSQNLYVADAPNSRIYRSQDGAASWTPLPAKVPCQTVKVDPRDRQSVYCGSYQEIRKSSDGGQTWVKHPLPEGANQINDLAFSPQDTNTVYAGGYGVFKSADGGATWAAFSSGLGGARVELMIDPISSAIYAETPDCRLYRSTDGGATWVRVAQRGCQATLDPNSGALYRTEWDHAIRSEDGGRTWTEIQVPEKNLQRIVVHPRDGNTLFAVYMRDSKKFMYMSIDRGKTWQSVADMGSIFIANLFFAQQQDNVMYTFGDLDAFRSADGGRTWAPCTRTGSWHAISPSRMIVDPRDSARLTLVTRGNGVLFSADGCQNWKQLNDGLSNRFVNAIAMDPKNPDRLYVGTDGGAFVSPDGGKHWQPIREGLEPNSVVYSVAVDPNDPSKVYAATPDGVFRLVGATTVSTVPASPLPLPS